MQRADSAQLDAFRCTYARAGTDTFLQICLAVAIFAVAEHRLVGDGMSVGVRDTWWLWSF